MNKFSIAQEILQDLNYDGWLIICNEDSDIHSPFMLGVKAHARHYIYIAANGNHIVIGTPMENPMIKKSLEEQNVSCRIESYSSISDLKSKLGTVVDQKRIALNYGEILNTSQNTEYADCIHLGDYLSLKSITSKTEFFSAAPIIYKLRSIKSVSDLDDLRETCKITMEILNDIPDWVKISMTEREVKARLDYEYLKLGEPSFDTIVATGANSADPHHNSSQQKIKEGVLLIDTGMRVNQMCSDITWTYWIGGAPSEKFLKAYSALNESKENSLKYYIDGMQSNLPAIKCRESLANSGYDHEKLFFHGLGHSIGFQVHDVGPRISQNVSKDEILVENMVYSNEPGLYWENEWGIRIEDDVIIKKEKCERVTQAPKDPLLI